MCHENTNQKILQRPYQQQTEQTLEQGNTVRDNKGQQTGYYTPRKGRILQEGMTIPNVYAPNTGHQTT